MTSVITDLKGGLVTSLLAPQTSQCLMLLTLTSIVCGWQESAKTSTVWCHARSVAPYINVISYIIHENTFVLFKEGKM